MMPNFLNKGVGSLGIRLVIILCLLAFDLLVLPAAVRLPSFIGGDLSAWVTDWLGQLLVAASRLLQPEGPSDEVARWRQLSELGKTLTRCGSTQG